MIGLSSSLVKSGQVVVSRSRVQFQVVSAGKPVSLRLCESWTQRFWEAGTQHSNTELCVCLPLAYTIAY